jgi:hypothetical protein
LIDIVDQVNFEWMRDGEQPLRNKSRGRIVHVSDFILEHCGRLCLTQAEIDAQLLLPKEPLPPSSVAEAQLPRTESTVTVDTDHPASSMPDSIVDVDADPRAPTTHEPSDNPPLPEPEDAAGPSSRRASTRVSKRRHLENQGYVSSEDEDLPDLLHMDDSDFEDVPELPPVAPRSTAKKPKKRSKKPAAEKAGKKKRVKKAAKAAAEMPLQGRTYAENDWVPPLPPAPFTAYQIPSFDARRIIFPGANYDPWWDMPQLIAQARLSIHY